MMDAMRTKDVAADRSVLPASAQSDGILFRVCGDQTFCRFSEWKAVFRRTTS
jgi:hypothetical protein